MKLSFIETFNLKAPNSDCYLAPKQEMNDWITKNVLKLLQMSFQLKMALAGKLKRHNGQGCLNIVGTFLNSFLRIIPPDSKINF